MNKKLNLILSVMGMLCSIIIAITSYLFYFKYETIVRVITNLTSDKSFLYIVLCTTVLFFLLILILRIINIVLKNNFNKLESIEMSKSFIDDKRSYLESQIADLNDKLVSTGERWNEAYHLILDSQKKQEDNNGVISMENFLNGFGIDTENIKISNDLVFVLTPFHHNYDQTYAIINDACRKANMYCTRGDEEAVSKNMLKQIVKSIVEARLIIVNLNGRNPNVFYELGIAHTLNKPTVLIAHTKTKIPFDVQNHYLVLYDNNNELKEKISKILLNISTFEN